jgi:hypothetical protein
MPAQVIRTRARFFVAVEGESEQSFVKWLQELSEEKLHIHLDAVPLGGGGFKSMLHKAVRLQARGCRKGPYRDRFLLVDADRAGQGDWSIEQLRREATKHKITVCAQNPNHEGLLFRMLPGMEREVAGVASAETKLKSRWPAYQKPMNAHDLGRKFSLADLVRVAKEDSDLKTLLQKIGLMADP